MAYPYFNPYYPQPMPDNLMQMRQQQMMQPMQQPMSQPVQQNPIAQGGVQWASGEQEARGYLIAPNSAVALWDSTAPTVKNCFLEMPLRDNNALILATIGDLDITVAPILYKIKLSFR